MESNLKDASDHDLLILINYQVGEIKKEFTDQAKRMAYLEADMLRIKTQMRTGWAIAVALGSISSFIIQHFVK